MGQDTFVVNSQLPQLACGGSGGGGGGGGGVRESK